MPLETKRIPEISEHHQALFWKKVSIPANKAEDCWLWTGGVKSDGYGNFAVHRKGVSKQDNYRCHILAWVLFHGKQVPQGKVLAHSCDVKLCVSPFHNRPLTQEENVDEMVERNRAGKPSPQPSPATVILIRVMGLSGLYSRRELAGLFGYERRTIMRICNGYSYKDLPLVPTQADMDRFGVIYPPVWVAPNPSDAANDQLQAVKGVSRG